MAFVPDTIDGGGSLPQTAGGFVPDTPPPNMAQGNKAFARVIGNSFVDSLRQAGSDAWQTVKDVGTVYAPIEAALNAGTGIVLGFPAYVGGGAGGLISKYGLGSDADPKELAETMQKFVTYQPQTEAGKRLSGNLMMPFTKLAEGSEMAGQAVTRGAMKIGASDNVAAAVGAITDSTIQMLAPALLAELGRKMGGQTVGAEDIANAAKVVVPGAKPEQIPAIEKSLRSVYDETGIGPYTILKDAAADPALRADLVDPKVDVPNAYRQYTEEFSGPIDETPEPLPRAAPEAKAAVQEQLARVDQEVGPKVVAPSEAAQPPASAVARRAGPETKTPEFKQWFGESKVVDEAGEPLVVYHGTDRAFDAFDASTQHSDEGFFFSNDPKYASRYASSRAMDQGLGANVQPVYLSVRNPLITDDMGPAAIAKAKAEGYDGVVRRGGKEIVVFDPTQIKSAVGNNGEFNPSSPYLLRSGIGPADVLKAARDTVADVKEVTNGIVNSEIGREVVSSVMPMSAGSEIAQATAQKFANSMRVARFQWQRMSEFLGDEFTPEERRAMWEAGQEENTIRTTGEDTGKGIASLTPRQQKVMGELHELGENLWKRAKATGMVQGDGVPYWVTRMAVQIGEDGEIGRLPTGTGDGTFTSDVRGLTTTASSLKQRKYLTAAETEAAMKAKFGDGAQLVRDIQTMPVAMSRLAQAISGRELISQLKELGQVSGSDIVSETVKPGFTTINHPAFTTYRPEFIQDAEGKMVPRVDADGNVVMQRTPMLIASDWAGPLKAVLSTKDGAVYSALMLAKSKAMTAIMISPAAHNMVIFGRALAYDPVAVGTLQAYFKGHALVKDAELMNQAIGHGMVPIGANKASMMDITDVARGLGEEGGWGDPNQSWINLSAQKVVSIFNDKAADTVKAKLDAFGDFWHHTLLWKQVGAVQTYIYNDYYNHLIENGHPPEVAGPIAANLANRYGGAVASENSSAWVRKALNVTLFSRSFNVGNIGAVHDAMMGLPAGQRALMFQEAGPQAAEAGLNAARFKSRLGLVTDLGMSMLMTGIVAAGVDKLLRSQTAEDIANGYVRRLYAMAGVIQEHPLNPTSYNPYQILPTWENEPGKQDRIDLGAQPGGRHEYVRLPTGKVVEDTIGWMLHAPETFQKKLSPLARSLWESVTNDKGYGVPVEDPDGNTLKHIVQGLQHVLAAQVPMEQIKTLWDVSQGVGTPIDKDKLIGFATGFTTSQGNPRGPEEGAFRAQQDRVELERKYAMDAVRDDIKHGRDAQAYARLATIGIPPREIIQTINSIKNPRQGMSRPQMKKFIAEATPEDRATLVNAQRQTQE